ncbi:MAG: hypothetical protein J6S26_03990 [Solobacterium sp.]|nr:hypothetical protein [Solobacterium sp.]
MNEKMAVAGRYMSLMMGVTISFVNSLLGNLLSGHFTIPGFLVSLAVSLAVSFLIGMIVPMGKVNQALDQKYGLKPGEMKQRIAHTLVSDCIYTPIMTLVMTTLAWRNAVKQGAAIPYLPMFLRSLVVSFFAAFVIIFIVEPIYLKKAMKLAGIERS